MAELEEEISSFNYSLLVLTELTDPKAKEIIDTKYLEIKTEREKNNNPSSLLSRIYFNNAKNAEIEDDESEQNTIFVKSFFYLTLICLVCTIIVSMTRNMFLDVLFRH